MKHAIRDDVKRAKHGAKFERRAERIHVAKAKRGYLLEVQQ